MRYTPMLLKNLNFLLKIKTILNLDTTLDVCLSGGEAIQLCVSIQSMIFGLISKLLFLQFKWTHI